MFTLMDRLLEYAGQRPVRGFSRHALYERTVDGGGHCHFPPIFVLYGVGFKVDYDGLDASCGF
jgi:hypothetical protein